MRRLTSLLQISLLALAFLQIIGASQVEEASTSPVPIAASSPKDISIGDFNNDRLPDLAVVSLRCNKERDPRCSAGSKGQVSLLVGDGRGGFEEFVESETVRSPYQIPGTPKAIAVADFDRDGNLDVAVTVSGKVIIRRGRGDFQLLRAKEIILGSGVEPSDLAVADLNKDGKMDIVTANLGSSGNSVSVILGDDGGSFKAPITFSVGNAPQSVVIADFNGDSNPDIATSNIDKQETVSILLGDGAGGFRVSHIGLDTTARGIAAADFDGNSHVDLVVVSAPADAVIILLGDGKGGFTALKRLNAGRDPISVGAADFNRDGNVDVAVVNAQGLAIFTGDGHGHLSLSKTLTAGRLPVKLSIGDLNRDSSPDIAVVNQGSNDVSIFLALAR